ncbi:hypothetical protein C9374_009250 [Naegleria lovaniensis]|uniref:Tr-type G domain-containing protein n=1 Tax=Naegleria lovaniensis TaxID=51637 RepID=A0AA88KK04_NAELO|nr:uncharacterized protein C9374_009250 [Naegleria lovaniensis]KAG2377339.1 hypothetical protein C9374_009250 [Naegleria lovaniensis]
MPRHSNFYTDEDLDDDYHDEHHGEHDDHDEDDPVLRLQDFILHGIDQESSKFILSVFPSIKTEVGEDFLEDVLHRNDGDEEASVNEIYELAQKEHERKKQQASNIVIKSKSGDNKANKNKQKTTQQQASSQQQPQQNKNQKTQSTGKNKKKDKDTKSNIIYVTELDHSTEISGTPTPTTEVSDAIFSTPSEKQQVVMSAGRGRGGLLLSGTSSTAQPQTVAVGRGASLLSTPSLQTSSSAPTIVSSSNTPTTTTTSVGGRGSGFINSTSSTTTTTATTKTIAGGRGTSLLSKPSQPVITTAVTPTPHTTASSDSSSGSSKPIPASSVGRGSSFSSTSEKTTSVKPIPSQTHYYSSSSEDERDDEELSSDEEYLRSVSSKTKARTTKKKTLDNQDEDLSEDEKIVSSKLSKPPLLSRENQQQSQHQESTIAASTFAQCLTTSLANESFAKTFFANSPERLSPYYEVLKLLHNKSKQQPNIPEIFSFNTPSPDDLVQSARSQHKTSHQPLENFQPIQKKQTPTKSKGDTSEKKKEPASPVPKHTTGKQIKPPQDSEKKRINVVIIGHVDAGKSTLMGHILTKMGYIPEKTLHKFKKESVEIGKSSFHFAWVMDEHEEERKRGVTMDVGVKYFETEHRHVTILDAPGHKDFISKMITGAAQADFAILVVDATPNGFETGFTNGGQTKEHLILARSLGVEQVIVVVNKLDTVAWSKDRFDFIVSQLNDFMKQIGYQTQDSNHVFYIPASAFQGDNLIEKSLQVPWYDGPTIVEQIDKLEPKPRDTEKALRLSVSDVYKSLATGVTIAGKIETGTLSEGDEVIVMPIKEVCTVKTLLRNKQQVKYAYAGDNVEIGLGNIDIDKLMVGQIICPVGNEIKVTNRFRARIVTFDMKIPILKGSHVVLHLHNIDVPAVITTLECILNRQQEIVEKKPRCILKNSNAIVEITTETPISIEQYSDFPKFGRLTIRLSGETVAAGVVEEVKKSKKKKEGAL